MTQQHIITILPELESTLFPQRPEERAELEADILAEGVRDPLVVWPREDKGDVVLVDGHNRYAIATEHGLPFEVVEKAFDSLEDVIEWIFHNQLGRRNLTDEQRAVAIGYLYEHRKPARGKPPKQQRKPEKFSDLGNDDDSKEESSEQTDKTNEPLTAQSLADTAGITEKSVRNAAKFARAYEQFKSINPEAAAKVVSGEIKDALTRLPTMTEQAMQEAAERVLQGETRLAAPAPKQRNIALDNPREAVILDALERLNAYAAIHATRLKDGSILVVADGHAHLLAVCGVEPKDVEAWQAAGTTLHAVGSDDEAVNLFVPNNTDNEGGAASASESDTDTSTTTVEADSTDSDLPSPGTDEQDDVLEGEEDEPEIEEQEPEEHVALSRHSEEPVTPLAFEDDDYQAHLEHDDLGEPIDSMLGFASQLEIEGGYATDDAEALARQMYGA